MVTKSYEPCTKSSQELAVKAGDVIRVFYLLYRLFIFIHDKDGSSYNTADNKQTNKIHETYLIGNSLRMASVSCAPKLSQCIHLYSSYGRIRIVCNKFIRLLAISTLGNSKLKSPTFIFSIYVRYLEQFHKVFINCKFK